MDSLAAYSVICLVFCENVKRASFICTSRYKLKMIYSLRPDCEVSYFLSEQSCRPTNKDKLNVAIQRGILSCRY